MLLTRDAILGAQDLKTEDVPVPEWGGTVRVRVMSGSDRDALGRSLVASNGVQDPSSYREKVLMATIVDEGGNRQFTEADIAALGAKSATALDRVFDVAERLNAIGRAAVEVEEKNSSAAPSGDSTSDLPAT